MLKQRVITALILAPLAIWAIFGLATPAFSWVMGGVVMLAAWEWANLSGWAAQWQRWLYALVVGAGLWCVRDWPAPWVLWPALVWWLLAVLLVIGYPGSARFWRPSAVRALMGLVILMPAWKALVILHGATLASDRSLAGVWVMLYVFCVVWAADIGAYFAGRAWGKRKLAPMVSPGKSWAGVYGGLAAVTLFALLIGAYLGQGPGQLALLVGVTLVTAVFSVIGDLCESMVKRFQGVKDSSQLLPGHGGILDRIDSLTAALPVFTLLASGLGWLV